MRVLSRSFLLPWLWAASHIFNSRHRSNFRTHSGASWTFQCTSVFGSIPDISSKKTMRTQKNKLYREVKVRTDRGSTPAFRSRASCTAAGSNPPHQQPRSNYPPGPSDVVPVWACMGYLVGIFSRKPKQELHCKIQADLPKTS